jgi:hypothetical protein
LKSGDLANSALNAPVAARLQIHIHEPVSGSEFIPDKIWNFGTVCQYTELGASRLNIGIDVSFGGDDYRTNICCLQIRCVLAAPSTSSAQAGVVSESHFPNDDHFQ